VRKKTPTPCKTGGRQGKSASEFRHSINHPRRGSIQGDELGYRRQRTNSAGVGKCEEKMSDKRSGGLVKGKRKPVTCRDGQVEGASQPSSQGKVATEVMLFLPKWLQKVGEGEKGDSDKNFSLARIRATQKGRQAMQKLAGKTVVLEIRRFTVLTTVEAKGR